MKSKKSRYTVAACLYQNVLLLDTLAESKEEAVSNFEMTFTPEQRGKSLAPGDQPVVTHIENFPALHSLWTHDGYTFVR